MVTILLEEVDAASTIIELNESGLKADDPEIPSKMIGKKEGCVHTLRAAIVF
ncbi:hypothetical protein [Peribacillus muralis]|uniref:hypothetical protein n=1 Tax=Peribacillus muralis TaxID=264697 RepID=UPI003CFFCEE8